MEQQQAPDYPRRSRRAANLENRALNHYSYIGDFSFVKEQLGLDVWEELKKFPVGIIAKLFEGKTGWSARTVHYLLCRQLKVEQKEIWSVVGDQPIRFSLLEFGEITGLNTDPVQPESIQQPDQYRKFWEELNVPHGFGPKPDELRAAVRGCRAWSFEKRKWLGLLVLQALGIYAGHHNSRIPFETAIMVFDDEAMMTYPWGRAAFEALVGSIKSLNPVGKTYYINGMSYALLAWAYESVSCFRERFGKLVAEEEVPLLRWDATRTRASFESVLKKEIEDHGHVRVRHMFSKEFVEEMFPQWPGQDDDPQLNNLIRDLHSGRYVPGDYWDGQREEKKKKKKIGKLALVPYDSESEPPKKKQKKAADIEKKGDEKGGSEDSGALNTIVATLQEIASKFQSHDSMFVKHDSMFVKHDSMFVRLESMVEKFGSTIGSKFEAIDSRFSDMEKKIGGYVKDAVKDAVAEKMKVLGLSESAQNYVPSPKTQSVPQQKSVQSPPVCNAETTDDIGGCGKKPSFDEIGKAESRTPQQYFPKLKAEIPKGTPDELGKAEEKAVGSKLKAEIPKGTPEAKKNLFGSDQPDFVTISPAKQPDLRRGSRRQNPKEIEADADLKKKADDAAKKKIEAAAKRKEKALQKKEEKAAAELRKKEEKAAAEIKKKEEKAAAELRKKAAELKKEVQPKGLRDGVIRIPTIPPTHWKKKVKTGGESDVAQTTGEIIFEKTNELLPESEDDEDERLRLARIKKSRARVVQLATTGLEAIPNAPSLVFPYVGDNGTTCMRRKDIEPSSAIYDPLAPVDPAKLNRLMIHLRSFEDIPLVDKNNEEASLYRILIVERPQWPTRDYGWLFDTHIAAYIRVLIKRSMQDPSPFCSKRIAFVDPWFLSAWIRDFNQFKMKPKMFKFKDTGYENLVNGWIPLDLPTNKKWLEDVDHLYGVLQTGGDHWVAFHVDLLKENIDVYDPIIGQVTPESHQKMLNAFTPLLQMIPAIINVVIRGAKTVSDKQFAFRWKSVKNIPQNTQVGDCGVYALKFIECLALGVTFDGICDANIQGLRVKMAAEILDEGGYDMMGGFN